MYIEETLAVGPFVGWQLAIPGLTYIVLFDTNTGQVHSTII